MKKLVTLAVSVLLLVIVVACSSMNERGVASSHEMDWDKHFDKKMKNYPASSK